MKAIKILVILMLCFVWASEVRAGELNLKEYRDFSKQHPEAAELLFAGMSSGILWTAIYFEKGKGPFCIPDNLPLTGTILKTIVDSYLRDRKADDKQMLGLMAIEALRNTFPCKERN